MAEDERLWEIKRQLHSFTKSPSLRHVRAPYFQDNLARDILNAVDRNTGPWQKWEGTREVILISAAYTSIAVEDLRDYLNELPGEKLTTTEVAQRLRVIHEAGFFPYPDEAFTSASLKIYLQELALGTEMIAIIGMLEQYVEEERPPRSAHPNPTSDPSPARLRAELWHRSSGVDPSRENGSGALTSRAPSTFKRLVSHDDG